MLKTLGFGLTLLATGAMGLGGRMGGWDTVAVDKETTATLLDALAKPIVADPKDLDAKPLAVKVCVRKVVAMEQQVVSGMNYRYHVRGVEIARSAKTMGWCNAKDTSLQGKPEKNYVIKVYEQAWTNTLKVTSIQEEAAPEQAKDTSSQGTKTVHIKVLDATNDDTADEEGQAKVKVSIHKTDGELSADEKQAIEEWIKAEGLNEYGDEKDVEYLGGTPLFDETTGTSVDRFDYIVSRHPERPWNPKVVQSVQLSAEEPTTSKTPVLAVVWMVAGAALVGTIVVWGRSRAGQRRAKYEAIRSGRTAQ